MKTFEQVRREIEECKARMTEAYEAAKRRGLNVPVAPEELARLEEICAVKPRRAPRPTASPATAVPEWEWIRC